MAHIRRGPRVYSVSSLTSGSDVSSSELSPIFLDETASTSDMPDVSRDERVSASRLMVDVGCF